MGPEPGSDVRSWERGDHRWQSIPDVLWDAAKEAPDRPAIVDGDVELSCAELDAQVWEAARACLAVGIERGDRVAIWAPNGWQWIVAAAGAQRAGAALVPLNTRFKGHEAADILVRSGARLLFCVSGFLGADHLELLRDSAGPPPS